MTQDASTSPLAVLHASGISAIAADEWRALARNQVYAQHGWLAVVEHTVTGAAKPLIVVVRRESQLRAAAIAYRLPAGGLTDRLVFGRAAMPLRFLGMTLGPQLFCGPLIGHGRYLLWHDDATEHERRVLTTVLCDELAKVAQRERRGITFARLPASESLLSDALRDDPACVEGANPPVPYLDVEWDNLEAYAASLRGRRTSARVRREISAPSRRGVELVRAPGSAAASAEVFSLVRDTARRNQVPLPFQAELFRALDLRHADQSIVTLARYKGRTLGAGLLLLAGSEAGGPLMGVASGRINRKAFTGFNLGLYEPLRFAMQHGIRRVWPGACSHALMNRRGCRTMKLSMHMRPRSAFGRGLLRLWCIVQRRRISGAR